MSILRFAVGGCLASLAFLTVSPAQASFRSKCASRAPECCENSVQSSCGAYAHAETAEEPIVETEPPLAEEPLATPIVQAPLVQAPVAQVPIYSPPVYAPPVYHPPVLRSPVPLHPIYDYMWAGPYYSGVPHYYDPSWAYYDRVQTRPTARGPVVKGRPEAYPALPYSEFANQQAIESSNLDNTRAQITVTVPRDDARVFMEGQLMKTTGRTRTFWTPPLTRGRTYEMEIRGEWQGDEPHTKRIEVRAGQTTTVELGR